MRDEPPHGSDPPNPQAALRAGRVGEAGITGVSRREHGPVHQHRHARRGGSGARAALLPRPPALAAFQPPRWRHCLISNALHPALAVSTPPPVLPSAPGRPVLPPWPHYPRPPPPPCQVT